MPRIFIVEDYPLMLDALTSFLNAFDSLEVCGSSSSAEEALARIPDLHPEIALVDVSLPGLNGLDFVKQMAERCPEMACLILSGHRSRKYIEKARQVGAKGYVFKGDLPALKEALRSITSGGQYFAECD